MDVNEVIDKGFIAHANVKNRLINIINGEEQAEPSDVRADNKCIIGEWIYGPGKDFSALPEYANLLDIHKAFHEEAYNALVLKQQGKDDEAMAYVNSGPFQQKSVEIQAALRDMKAAAKSA